MTSADAFTADTTDGLRPGTWEIAETTAPVGYTGTAEPQQVTVSFENQSVEIEPIANTNEAPVISGGDLTVSVGDDVTPLTGLTATDKEDGDITGKIEIVDDGGFDVQKPGTYTVVVKVTDAGGKTTGTPGQLRLRSSQRRRRPQLSRQARPRRLRQRHRPPPQLRRRRCRRLAPMLGEC